mgnify:CR=1 FL=1
MVFRGTPGASRALQGNPGKSRGGGTGYSRVTQGSLWEDQDCLTYWAARGVIAWGSEVIQGEQMGRAGGGDSVSSAVVAV